jgi:fructokinase
MRIGIDLGGTKTEVIAISMKGEELLRERVDTVKGDYAETLATIDKLVKHAEQSLKQTGSVGIGTPGAISPTTGLLKNSNSTWLNGKPVQQDIESAINRPVRIANDANCFVLSEAIDGAGKEFGVVFGVIIGTGTGGGIAVNKKILVGPNAIAGEWGHNAIPWPDASEMPGPQCYCGKRGCVETFLSGPCMAGDYNQLTGFNLSANEIVSRAEQGEFDAVATVKRYEQRLAKSLASVINIVDPDAIVLGGGLSNIPRLYENVPKLWGKYVFSDTVATKLLPAKHGDSSGVRGAAWLWSD